MATIKPTGRWQVTLGDEELGIFDEYTFTLNDAFVLENESGLSILDMLAGVNGRRAAACRALVWFMRYQASPATPHITTINFNIADLKMAVVPNPPKASSDKNATGISDFSPSTAT